MEDSIGIRARLFSQQDRLLESRVRSSRLPLTPRPALQLLCFSFDLGVCVGRFVNEGQLCSTVA